MFDIYGDTAIAESPISNCFAKVISIDFDLENLDSLVRLRVIHDDRIKRGSKIIQGTRHGRTQKYST